MADAEPQPKPTSDAADFVVKLVGYQVTFVTVVAIIAAAVLGIVGYKTLQDVEPHVLAKVQESINQEVKETIHLAGGEIALLKAVSWISDDYILYGRYNKMFESLILDSLTAADFEEIDAIQRNIIALKSMNIDEIQNNIKVDAKKNLNIDGAKDKIEEMSRQLHAIYDYKCSGEDKDAVQCRSHEGRLEHALEDIDSKELHNVKTPMKYRMLFSVYAKLFDQQIKPKTGAPGERSEEAEKEIAQVYLSGLQEAAEKFAAHSKPSNVNVKLIQAVALAREARFIERYVGDKAKEKSKYNNAIEDLKMAEELGPSDVIAYNLASYYSRIEMFDQAIEQLKKIRNWGGFRNARDVTFFKNDLDFAKLRFSRGDQLKKLNL